VPDRFQLNCLIAVLILGAGTAEGQTSIPKQLTSFLKQNCVDCHSGDTPEGGLNLQANFGDLSDGEVRRRWVYLHDRVAVGEMPPKSKARPSAESISQFLETLGNTLTRADISAREIVLRRLNRNEYENTARDLFGIYVDVKRVLPDDSTEQGFDTTASALSLSAEQMVRYVEAADLVLDRVFGPPKKPITISKTVNFATTGRGTDSSERKLSDGVVLFSGAKYLPMYDTSLPAPGLYRVRMKIRAEQTDEPVVMQVMGGTTGAIAAHTAGFFEALPGKVTSVEFIDRSPERSDCFSFGLVGGFPWWKVDEKEYKGPGLFIGDIQIEGPIDQWPPTSRGELLGGVDPATGTLDDIRAILTRKLPQAFRRSTEAGEVEPFVSLAKQAFDDGLPFEMALRRGLKGVICAPDLLFLEERTLDSEHRGTIDDYSLASRLSYFLWSSMPDGQLLSLADRGELHKPKVLRAQTERMLSDPKSARFVESFTGQWLRLYDLDFTVPDRNLYPEYGQLLRQSMLDETHAFFREVLNRDHSVNEFIDSDFAMLNKPLADFYGIDGVKGLKVYRIELPDESVRGGVLTQASVLKISADGTKTSPVLRGAWILKYLYGMPSPPPPSNIKAIEPDIRGATTIREQLAKHREHESCNRCHQKIDPPGFALESFDVIGAHRNWYRTRGSGKDVKVPRHPQAPFHYVQYRQGADVDASGTMPDGRTFADIREYKRLLLSDTIALPRSLARLLLTYSLGRQLSFSDRPEVERIVESVKTNDYGLRSMVHEIVQSNMFRQR
jgi:hypothetical protein